jgi:hypothetical protein
MIFHCHRHLVWRRIKAGIENFGVRVFDELNLPICFGENVLTGMMNLIKVWAFCGRKFL